MNKNICLVSISDKSPASLRYMKSKRGFFFNLRHAIDMQIDPKFPESPERQEHLEKLKKATERVAKMEGTKPLIFRMETSPTTPSEASLYIRGEFIKILQDIWGKDLGLRVEGHFTYPDPYTRMFTAEFSSSNKEIICDSGLSTYMCFDIKVLGEEFKWSVLELKNTTVTLQFRLFVEDEVLPKRSNNADGLQKICKTIQSNRTYSDVSIVANDSSVFPANKCFLVVHSPVLKACMENFEESKTNKIHSAFSGGCVQALLEFIYTLEIPNAIECSKLAVELFQAAHFYEMVQLEEMLSEMIFQKGNSWFDVNAAIELFRFVGKIETYSCAKLKSKLVQVLKEKECELKDSDNFKSLFAEDWNTALEFCVMALKK
ncbi:unnamed protein product [Orchesella dallaii]|uniref:BTB domain-containing protein n=1 Tax=Orchesella dallaii TaxID=48710 RepID=A0ABP1RZJ8_9HEXA